jgi:hypothetical protein
MRSSFWPISATPWGQVGPGLLGEVGRDIAERQLEIVDDREELGQERAVGVADLLLELLGGATLVVDKVGLSALRKVVFELGLNGQVPSSLGSGVSLGSALLFWMAHRHLRYRGRLAAEASMARHEPGSSSDVVPTAP